MRTILRYEDGRAVWSENVPSRAHLSWKQQGSIAGEFAGPARSTPPGHTAASYAKGIETKRLRGQVEP